MFEPGNPGSYPGDSGFCLEERALRDLTCGPEYLLGYLLRSSREGELENPEKPSPLSEEREVLVEEEWGQVWEGELWCV